MTEIHLQKTLNTSNGTMQLDINLTLKPGELITLYGESGAGKTTALKMIAGLTTPDSGKIVVDDVVWFNSEKGINLKPQKRNIGVAFQDYALFPHMTVRENLEYAAKEDKNKNFIISIIKTIDLEELQHKKPLQLSGGQQQRVALARALVQQPKFLLLDEPLSALDVEMRSKLQDFILKIHKELKCTTLLISHDIEEILKISDSVYILKNGEIVTSGTPEEVFSGETTNESFQFTGKVTDILIKNEKCILSVIIGNQLIKANIPINSLRNIKVGDTIQIGPKTFEPIIKKVES